MKNSICFFIISLLFFIPVFLPAQTAAEIEVLLDTPALSYEQAARFVLRAADVTADISPAEAFHYAQEKNWLPKKAESNGQASLGGVSLLIMRSFDIKGGLFYSLFKNQHYAYRELVYKDVIQGRFDPGMAVSGDQLLFMVNRVLSGRPGNEELDFDIDKYINPAADGAI